MTVLAALPQRVAWVPGAPVLVPELAMGGIGEVDNVRGAVRHVLSRVMEGIGSALVVGAGSGSFEPGARGSFADLGRDVPVRLASTPARSASGEHRLAGMSLPLLVGAHLLNEEVGRAAADVWALGVDAGGPAAPASRPAAPWALIVVADGSTRRTPGAPGSFHPDAQAWDTALADALAGGDAAALGSLSSQQAHAVGCHDVAVWQWAGLSLPGSWSGELVLHEAPLGVGYFVASWSSS